MSPKPVRALSAQILCALEAGRGSLSTHLAAHQDINEFPLLQELCFGTCRWYPLLNALLDPLLKKPLKKKDRDIHWLILSGIYQLREMRNPEYASINETVNAVASLEKEWARPLVNGVLRNFQRQAQELEQRAMASPEGSTAHPAWLVQAIRTQWPEQAEQIIQANNQRPPLSLRVNLAKQSRQQAMSSLLEVGIGSLPGALTASSIIANESVPVAALPGFTDGMLSVQDEASQLVPSLIGLEPDQRLLDACAAPGGKTCHLLESEHLLSGNLSEIVALDISAERNQRLKENLQRLGLQAQVVQGNAAEPASWWDGVPFDRILLDAPCSGTGVIRRHPDIKLLRSQQSLDRLKETQLLLLKSVWQCLRVEGRLLYTTCSVLREENEAIIEQFLNTTDNAKNEAIAADWGVECRYGRQLLPETEKGPDGFYFCLLSKEQ